jgi:class 3 adenylate cyclase
VAGSKAAPTPAHTSAGRTPNPAAFTLVHFVPASKTPLFSPTRLMNPISYIGRTQQNDVVLGSENVSRRHAKIIVTDAGVTVHDLDSHNGVFLNGKKVRSAPVNVGDLLYVADVCLELRRSPDAGALSPSFAGDSDITGEEDPDVRSLAALLRAAEVLATGDEGAAQQLLEICRELVEANVAVLVRRVAGDMTTPVVLQAETGTPATGAPVLWPIVQKACDDAAALLSPDLKDEPVLHDESVLKSGVGAVIAIPVVPVGGTAGGRPVDEVIYLSRPTPGPLFTARQMPTLTAIAQLLALRHGPAPQPHAEGNGPAPAHAEAAEENTDVHRVPESITGVESDEEQQRLRDALARAEQEHNQLKTDYQVADDERKARQIELVRLRDSLKASDARDDALAREISTRDEEIARLTSLLETVSFESKTTREGLEQAVSAQVSAAEELKTAMRATVPPGMAEHIEAAASEQRELLTEAAIRPVAALYIMLRGFDAWAVRASPEDIKRRLDHFCNSVALRARANGGRVEQVLGHAHLLTFAATVDGVGAAVRCGLEVSALVPDESSGPSSGLGPIGVASGLHVGASASGYFGEGDTATHVEAGEAIMVARGVASLAPDSSFFVTDAVHKLVSWDPSFVLGMMGPAPLVGGPTVSLFKVSAATLIALDDEAKGDA